MEAVVARAGGRSVKGRQRRSHAPDAIENSSASADPQSCGQILSQGPWCVARQRCESRGPSTNSTVRSHRGAAYDPGAGGLMIAIAAYPREDSRGRSLQDRFHRAPAAAVNRRQACRKHSAAPSDIVEPVTENLTDAPAVILNLLLPLMYPRARWCGRSGKSASTTSRSKPVQPGCPTGTTSLAVASFRSPRAQSLGLQGGQCQAHDRHRLMGQGQINRPTD